MSYQKWQVVLVPHGASSMEVKADIEVVDELYDQGLGIRIREDGYPWVVSWRSSCDICAEKKDCGCSQREGWAWEEPLHFFVWDFFKKKNRDGLVIHHVDEDKMNARIKNLGIGTQSQHRVVHNANKRKFGRKKKFNSCGLYRPQDSRNVKTPENSPELAALLGAEREPENKPSAGMPLGLQLKLFERHLEKLIEPVMEATADLDEDGESIPRSAPKRAWNNGKTRKLGLKMRRLECTLAETVFVRLYASADFDIPRVAEVVASAPQDRATAEALLRMFLKRPSVAEWVNRWSRYHRLPSPPRR